MEGKICWLLSCGQVSVVQCNSKGELNMEEIVIRVIRVMRAMAWERARGELRSMQHTFYTDSAWDESDKAYKMTDLIEEFIHHVEENMLHE